MFNSVLIANRGEIACRIIRTARRLGMRTIAVYSQADRNALHVRLADEAHEIGPAPAAQSYLRGDVILDVARASKAACLHPGYGFLSENAEFAEACAAAGVVFVGPPPKAIRAMGLKDEAKALMRKSGVPVVPGYDGAEQTADHLADEAKRIGYPVLIKAVAGGGGKGMRKVERAADFADALASAQREAQSSFGNPRVLIEKYVSAPRHIEIQVFADSHGHALHLFERDCTMQRRHQKVIEEAPAPGMNDETRSAMGEAAVAAARAVGYVGAGTVEFIADGSRPLSPDSFWFMEMNTRLQVEHPVTEAVTGLDLVEMQFRVAAGGALGLQQADIRLSGHAIETRLYAEDPNSGFLPSTGRILALDLPVAEGVRVDAGVAAGNDVTPFYDPMIAKIIAHAPIRAQAIKRLADALAATKVFGPRSNAGFLHRLVTRPEFASNSYDTGFIERHLEDLGAVPQPFDEGAVAFGAAVALAHAGQSNANRFADPWAGGDAFQLGAARRQKIAIAIEGERATVDVEWRAGEMAATYARMQQVVRHENSRWIASDPLLSAHADENGVFVLRDGRQVHIALFDALDHADEASGSDGNIVRSPMHGKLVTIFVAAGDAVEKGQRLAIVEAMKMEHVLMAPVAGRVGPIGVHAGQQVAQNAALLTIETETGDA
ncbi:MAG: carbamoyl-phosphate synthase subunit L [Rhizobiales bacterium 62-17]|nr:ATP-grasp domain-containing protein [Hyphomicrobiales bacterium]OJY03924.1 MAG: carbamoyl-phosphate synthase subunit L [Rhizobiales bacterium 62-17]